MKRALDLGSSTLWAAAFVGLVGSTSCGGDEAGTPSSGEPTRGVPQSGSRLEVRGHFVNEGLGSNLGFYDKELGLPCFAATLADAEGTYCVPSQFVEVFFTDETCADEGAIAYLRSSTCLDLAEDDLVYSQLGSAECNSRLHLYRLAETIEPPAQLYWRTFVDGSCEPIAADDSGTFRSIEPTPPDVLAALTRRLDDVEGADVQVGGEAGDDGSFLPIGLYANDDTCSPTETVEGTRCLPSSMPGAGSGFSDESCTTPGPLVQLFESPCFERPEYVQVPTEDECPVVERFERVSGAPVAAYAGSEDACVAQEAPLMTFAEREEVPLTSLAPIESTWVGGGDIEARVRTSNGVPVGRALEFRVRETGTSCQPYEFDDGSARCVPARNFGHTGTTHYSDPSCEEELYGGYPFAACGEEPSLDDFVFVETDAENCAGAAVRAIRLVPYEGTLYVRNSLTDACEETAESLTSDSLFVAGDEIPRDELPALPLTSLP